MEKISLILDLAVFPLAGLSLATFFINRKRGYQTPRMRKFICFELIAWAFLFSAKLIVREMI